ncbi:hypothetical protein K432DRAFT_427999 [Lepidopterella palustris CBS 459.81]|uniref:Uncharacterized protein n=1 Tax=Lepidopterella palustris CBS 459.81 TaxID=1314670 RepID=A0A8E2E4W7_9PEZI|nr:hypothetical protein K432DRAFT_427999 [Lepidopterella palustris CBS 459.81]
MASSGYIVAINVSPLRSDELVITAKGARSLPLLKLEYEEVMEHAKQIEGSGRLVRGGVKTARERNLKMLRILRWLWECAVEPIFAELNLTATTGEMKDMPRIWWIVQRIMNLFPIHAAGDHSPGSVANNVSRAVSSYTPTIKSLKFSQENTMKLLTDKKKRFLMVPMPTTPVAYLGRHVCPGCVATEDSSPSSSRERTRLCSGSDAERGKSRFKELR